MRYTTGPQPQRFSCTYLEYAHQEYECVRRRRQGVSEFKQGIRFAIGTLRLYFRAVMTPTQMFHFGFGMGDLQEYIDIPRPQNC